MDELSVRLLFRYPMHILRRPTKVMGLVTSSQEINSVKSINLRHERWYCDAMCFVRGD